MGCDRFFPHGIILNAMFQSTHPRGVRLLLPTDVPNDSAVSIHAPAWGATMLIYAKHKTKISFNPRTRVGCDIQKRRFPLSPLSFNPRTRVGCDRLAFIVTTASGKFQSTHPRGVRRFALIYATVIGVFQSTHPRGVRLSSTSS